MNCKPLKHFCVGGPQYGLNVSSDQYAADGIRLLRTTDIDRSGNLTAAESGVYLDPALVPAEALLRQGDLLLSRSGTLGRSLLVGADEDLTYAGYLVRFRPRADTEPRYLRYCAESTVLQDAIGANAIQSTIGNFNGEKYASVRLPSPLPDEQRAIADYLDRETARIDALIAAKQETVALWKERLQANRDSTFAFKHGLRLKHVLAGPMAYGVLVPTFVDDGPRVPMIRTYNLTPRGQVASADVAEIPVALADEYRRTQLRPGDVILSVVGSMGRAAVVGREHAGANLNRPLARLQPRRELPARLLWQWTQTTWFMDAARLATDGGTAQPTLNLGDLANFRINLPADRSHWPSMLERLERATAQFERFEDAVTSQVRLLFERRLALITAAVTGQLPISVPA